MLQKRRLTLFLAAIFLLVPTLSNAQAIIKVNDAVSLRFGTLIQAWADDAQDPTTKAYAKNLFLRRFRFIVSGTLSPNVSFFFETDNPNLGKAPKALGTGFITQDAYVEWKPAGNNAFMIDAGLMLPPLCRDCLASAATLLSLDYNSWSFLESAPTQSSVGRDTGFLAKGYLAGGHFEYRGGVFQGLRETGSKNGFRTTGRAQYNVWDTETGYVYPEAYLGNKKILALGAGLDRQQNYKAYTADAQLSVPVGVAKNEFNGILTLYRLDGGTTFTAPALAKQSDLALQLGYYLAPQKVMPFVRYEKQNFSASANKTRDNNRVQAGIGWYPNGNNFNIKGAYTRVDPRAGNKTSQFTIQTQFFYY
jgi:Phosphate-selective porin O and P